MACAQTLASGKGYVIVGQDTDGSVTPNDLGMDWIVSKNKDFIGKRSLFRADTIRPLYFNCGWGTGGFKATPGSGWVFAHTVANDEPHRLNAAFELDRFYSGALIDEHGAAGVAH